MTRGNTPTIVCSFEEGPNLTQASHIYMTFQQNRRKITKTDDELTISENSVACSLTQEETLYFISTNDPVEIQLNWTYENGQRGQSSIETIDLNRTLEPEVLE